MYIYDPKYLNVETGPKRTSILDDLKFHFSIKISKAKKTKKTSKKIIESFQYF